MPLRDLTLRLRALIAPRRVEQELDEELAFHLACEARKLVEAGLSPADAETRARARFGSVALAADRCRDVRGTGLIDDTVRDILYAGRSCRRAPLSAITIIATVALGLALVAMVFTVFNAFFFRVDAVRDPEQLFTLQRMIPHRLPGGSARAWIPFTRPEYETIARENTLFSGVCGVVRGIATRIDGRPANGTLVTGNFFHVLGVDAALGRPLTPADEHAGSLVIVLSHRGWNTLVARDPAAIGRIVRLNGTPAEIVGVMPEGFRGLALGAPDYWAPLALAGRIRASDAGREDQIAMQVVVRMQPGASPLAVIGGLPLPAVSLDPAAPDGRRPVQLRLTPSRGTVGDDAREALIVFVPLFVAFALVLLIGCANVANLLLARGVSRQREVGIRLALGASRRRIVRQLLTESLLLALAAAACALVVSQVLLQLTIHAVVATMPPEMAEQLALQAPPLDWRVVLFIVAGAILSTALFGLVPALHATRLEPVRTMRGELVRDARPGLARNGLISVQVTASALLLICAAIFLRSTLSASSATPGVRTSDTMVVDVGNEPLRPAILHALRSHPGVAGVAASWPRALDPAPTAFAEAGDATTRLGVGYRFVSPDYFALLDVDVVGGRGFTGAERIPDTGVVVVSASTAQRLWPGGEAVGQVVRLESVETGARTLGAGASRFARPSLPSRTFVVVGVVRDVGDGGFRDPGTNAVVYVPVSHETAGTSLTLRVHGDPVVARLALGDRLTALDPAIGTIMMMRTMAGLEAYLLRIAFSATIVLGGLALALTLSGLFSVLSYIVAQRRQEIGIRLALGATTWRVARLVFSESAGAVAAGVVAGAALAAGLATLLTKTGATAPVAHTVHVLDPVAYVSSAVCIVIACAAAASIPGLRAARVNPIDTLRTE